MFIPEEANKPAEPACDCAVCKAGLTPTLNAQEHELLYHAALVTAYLLASKEIQQGEHYETMLRYARFDFRNAAAALGGTWTLARALTDSE